MTQEEHSRNSPSSSPRWTVCPGSTWDPRNNTNKAKSPTEIYANAGTIIHKKAAEILQEILEYDKIEYLNYEFKVNFTRNEIAALDEAKVYRDNAIRYIRDYIKYIALVESKMRNRQLYIEIKVDFTKIAPGLTYDDNNAGTADCVIHDRAKRELHVIDLKTGMRKVEVHNNKQLLIYAIGAYLEINQPIDKIIIHVVQPSIHNNKSCDYSMEEINKWMRYFYERAVATLTPLAPRIPSQEACKYCGAKSDCPALLGFVKNVVDIAKQDNEYSQDTILYILDNSKLINNCLNDIKEQVYNKLQSGVRVGNYKIVPGKKLKVLNENAESVLKAKYGNSIYQLAPVTKLKEVVAAEDLEPLIEYKECKPELVTMSDSRQQITEEFQVIG